MGFRFRKTIKILPGVRINLTKSGVSLSLGTRGASFNISPKGTRTTLGLPGSGISYSKTSSFKDDDKGDKEKSKRKREVAETPIPENLSASERALMESIQALNADDTATAYAVLQNALELADSSFLAGLVALQMGNADAAISHLQQAQGMKDSLGEVFAKLEFETATTLEITEEITVHVQPDEKGVGLALAEAYQAKSMRTEAIDILQQIQQLDPDDITVRLSLAELILDDEHPDTHEDYQAVVKLAEGIENDSEVHTGLLYYRARALQGLGLMEVAKDTLTAALKKKTDRSKELMLALKYQRALVCEAMGEDARQDFEEIYAESPDYEDVAKRLGL